MTSVLKVSGFILLLSLSGIQAQTITSVDPNEGTQCERLIITVTGENTNFYQGTSFVKLRHEGHEIPSITNTVYNSFTVDGEFLFSMDDPTGSYDVIVDHWLGNWDAIIDSGGFVLNAVENPPVLDQMSPNIAEIGDSVIITIVGRYTHFNMDGINNSIRLDIDNWTSIFPKSETIIDNQTIECLFFINYNAKVGDYSLLVTNEVDGTLYLEKAFTVEEGFNLPEIVSTAPDFGFQGQQLTVVVTGRNIVFQQASSYLSLYDWPKKIHPYSQNVLNDTVITGDFVFNSDYDTGYYDVVVENWYLGYVMKEGGFHLMNEALTPNIDTISPNNALLGTRISFLIKTINTHFGEAGNPVSITLVKGWEELYCHDITVVDSVTVQASYIFSHANDTGLHNLIVYAPLDGTLKLDSCVNLLASTTEASISSVVPDTASQRDTLIISVAGKNIVFMQGTSQLNMTHGNLFISPTNQTIVNDTVITGEFNFLDNFPAGKYDVNVDGGYAWPSLLLPEGFSLKLFDFIGETDYNAMLTIYPNPAKELLNIKRNFGSTLDYQIQLFNTQGQLVMEEILSGNISESQINLSSIEKGVYLIKVTQDKAVQTERIVIQ